MKKIEIGAKYRHYKGKEYEIIGVAKHSETLEDMIVYKPLYEIKEFRKDLLWVRPMNMFFEKVVVGGKRIDRFKKVK